MKIQASEACELNRSGRKTGQIQIVRNDRQRRVNERLSENHRPIHRQLPDLLQPWLSSGLTDPISTLVNLALFDLKCRQFLLEMNAHITHVDSHTINISSDRAECL